MLLLAILPKPYCGFVACIGKTNPGFLQYLGVIGKYEFMTVASNNTLSVRRLAPDGNGAIAWHPFNPPSAGLMTSFLMASFNSDEDELSRYC